MATFLSLAASHFYCCCHFFGGGVIPTYGVLLYATVYEISQLYHLCGVHSGSPQQGTLCQKNVKYLQNFKLHFLPRFVKKVVINAAGLFPTMMSLFIVQVRSVTVMQFTSPMHVLVLYIANASARSCTEN